MILAKDKQLHILVGLAIGAAGTALTGLPVVGIGASVVAAWGKEAYDRRTPGHTYDPWDAHATTLGGIVSSAVWMLLQ